MPPEQPKPNPLIQILANVADRNGLTKEQMLEVITEGYQAQLEALNGDIASTQKSMRETKAAMEGYQARLGRLPNKDAEKEAKQAIKRGDKYLQTYHDRITEDVANSVYLVALPLIQMKEAGLPLIVHQAPHEEALEKRIEAAKRALFGENGVMHPKGRDDDQPLPNMTILKQMMPKDILDALNRMGGDMPKESATLESLGIETTMMQKAKDPKGARGLN